VDQRGNQRAEGSAIKVFWREQTADAKAPIPSSSRRDSARARELRWRVAGRPSPRMSYRRDGFGLLSRPAKMCRRIEHDREIISQQCSRICIFEKKKKLIWSLVCCWATSVPSLYALTKR